MNFFRGYNMFAKTVERMKKERKDKEREKLTRQLKLSKLYRQNVFNDLKRTDVFIAETNGRCPEGFCSYAWKDIHSDLRVLVQGGDHEPWVESPKMISCCTDGIRPVSFMLERIEN